KNRTFFFVNYEGVRQRLAQTQIAFVPSAAFRAQAAATSPALQPLLQAYPVGQTPVNANINQFTIQGRNPVREDSGMVRVDHKFTDNTTVFVRYTVDDAFIDKPSGALGSRDTTAIRPSNLVLQMLRIFSPSVVNEAKVGMNRSAFLHPTVGI